jgi:DNA-binding LytR/AlgR family response regulator
VKILVVDDEPLARARLIRLLARMSDMEVVGEASSGSEALALIETLAPDLVLLDIDMPAMDGISVAESPGMPPVVFTTAHPRYALEAFEADAYDYLLKPVGKERLERAIEKVRQREQAAHASEPPSTDAPWRLIVTDGSLKRFFDARRIGCFLADQKYVTFRYEGEEMLLRESLDTLEERLKSCEFLRPHRGALVRKDAVVAFDAAEGGTLVLDDGERIPVSRRAIASVRAALGL